jgi:FkbM family methyltransferase
MRSQFKSFLEKIGLFAPAQRLRRRFTNRTSPDPRAGIINHAKSLMIGLQFGRDQIEIRKSKCEIRINHKHEAYLADMINFFDYYHGAVVSEINNGISVVDYSQPRLQRLTRSGVEFEFPSLPESDESTETYMEALDLQPGEAVFDLGAYAGASAYFLSKAVGKDGIVVSFEPDETNYHYLIANIARHQLTNVRAIKKGIWNETTVLEFQAEGNMGSSAVSMTGRKSNVKAVPVVSLEDAVTLAGIPRVTAIKMDIEGAEITILRTAAHFLQTHRPKLVIEPHVVEGKMATEEICQILRDNAYQVELLHQGVQDWPLIAARPV